MYKVILTGFIYAFALFTLHTNYGFTTSRSSSSPPLNRCGLYGTQPTCTVCHSPGSGGSGAATISISGNPTSYVPGTVYSITVTGSQVTPTPAFYGFEMAAVNASNANAGAFTAISGTNIGSQSVAGNSISFIRQSTPKVSGTWTFNWTAPATDVGNIRFYLAVNAANGTSGTGSDYIYTSVFTLTPACNPPVAALTSNTNVSCDDVSTLNLNTFVATTSAPGTWTGTAVTGGNTFSPATAGVGTYNLTFTTGSGSCTDTEILTETVKQKPTPTIIGSGSVCVGETKTYSVTPIAGTTYQWTVTGGTIVSGGGTSDNTITVLWTASSGTINLTQIDP